MTDRAMQGLTPLPSSRREIEQFVRELKHDPDPTPEQLNTLSQQVERTFPGGFDQRDEANAIIAMAVRNGPLENLHAGNPSPLLEDDSLSPLADPEIKAVLGVRVRRINIRESDGDLWQKTR